MAKKEPLIGTQELAHYAFNYHIRACREFVEIADKMEVDVSIPTRGSDESDRLTKIWLYLSSHIFASFAIESAMNFVLASTPGWSADLEKKPWKEKVKMLAKHLGWSNSQKDSIINTLWPIFEYRNSIAHAKHHEMVSVTELTREEMNEKIREKSKVWVVDADWIKTCNSNDAQKVIADADEFLQTILPARIVGKLAVDRLKS